LSYTEKRRHGIFTWGSKTIHVKPRPVFFVKGHKLQKGTLASNGEVADAKPIESVSTHVGDYESVNAPNLYPAKEAQRSDLIKSLGGGAVLELNAGRGNLTKEVYAKKLDKAVLVDSDKKALASADKKLKGKIKHETNVANNVRWLENEMSPEGYC
jgi:hypothetical protein